MFSRWQALADVEVTEPVDHPFRWVQIEKFIIPPEVRQTAPGMWIVDDKLRLQRRPLPLLLDNRIPGRSNHAPTVVEESGSRRRSLANATA